MTQPAAPRTLPVLPTVEDPFVRAVSTVLGGPPGRHARLFERRFWVPVRVLVFLAVLTGALGWGQKSLCDTHGYVHEYQYTRVCYTDVYALWFDEHLDTGKIPILDNETPTPDASGHVTSKYVEYPVVIGGVMAAGEGLTHLLMGPNASERAQLHSNDPGTRAAGAADLSSRRGELFFNITAAFLILCGAIVTVLTGLTAGRRRIWDAALFAVAPALLLNADVNWDLVAVAFTAGALFAWSRRAPAVAGLLLGCGVATKFYPVVLLIPLLALCLRAGRMRSWWRLTGAAVATWLVVDVPVWIANPAGFGRFYAFSRSRGTEYNSLFYAWQYAVFHGRSWDASDQARGLPPSTLNLTGEILLAVLLLAIVVLILAAPRRPRLGQVAFLTVYAFVITNKVYSPQYVLWLLPLVALARPRWRYWLVWQATEVILLVLLYFQLIFVDTAGANQRGISYAWFFWLGDFPRDMVLLGLCGLIVGEVLRPGRDIVRATGDDDPAGGPLDGAPDRLVLTFNAHSERSGRHAGGGPEVPGSEPVLAGQPEG